MMKTFMESGMTFGPFQESQVFGIEQSRMLSRCQGIKSVEFIYHKKKYVLMFIEAKSSSPIKRSGNMENYERFLEEITQKFVDSFELYVAGLLKRKSGYDEISTELMNADYEKMKFVFALVIHGHEEMWLPPLAEDLKRKMKRFQEIWKNELIVMNEKMAKEENLVI